MRRSVLRRAAFVCVLASVIGATLTLSGVEGDERFLIKCDKPCASVVSTVAALGGTVTQAYENIDAVAVSVPRGRARDLSAAIGEGRLRKDVIVALPPRAAVAAGEADGMLDLPADAADDFFQDLPANYNYNNGLTGASTLHGAGIRGQNIVVAVIDSGTASAIAMLGTPPGGTPTVIGGESLVPPAEDPVASATSRLNDWHGTAVAGMIAAHANFLFSNTQRLVQSLNLYAPGSVFLCGTPPFTSCPPTQSVVPMFGTAPAAEIYALKVFPSQGGGAPGSRIIAAMDRVITLRRNFNSGMPTTPVSGTGTENDPFQYNALDIQVVNMSLGGPTLFAGRDIEDELTVAMVDAGITLTTAAGNAGFAAMTGGSPGTGLGGLTVGAATTPVHERVVRDNQLGVGFGELYRPTDHVQTAYFSARGPTADGRLDPELVANGDWSYVNVFGAVLDGFLVSCGAPGVPPSACLPRIIFTSGASFASPTVAGAAALLRQQEPEASAVQTRNALVIGANPTVVQDGSGAIDQGAGFLDVPASLELLASGDVPDELPGAYRGRHHHQRDHSSHDDDSDDDDDDEVGGGGKSVIRNVRKLGFKPVRFVRDRYSKRLDNLLPGQVAQFFVPSDERTDRLIVTISGITREGPVNTLLGDDLFLMGVDAPTSFAVHRIEDPPGSEGVFVGVDSTYTIDQPQTGLVRIALQGSWTNGGRISATVAIERERGQRSHHAAHGRIEEEEVIPFRVNLPAGAAEAVIDLFWRQNWGRYPTNDLDLLVLDPNLDPVLDENGDPAGATEASPERVVVANPIPGEWTLLVNGFTVHQTRHHGKEGKDSFTLRASADGKALKIKK